MWLLMKVDVSTQFGVPRELGLHMPKVGFVYTGSSTIWLYVCIFVRVYIGGVCEWYV